jgi:hypothetical protein
MLRFLHEGSALKPVQAKRFLKNLPNMLTFIHRLKQIGFLQSKSERNPDLDLAAIHSVGNEGKKQHGTGNSKVVQ